MLKAMIVHTLLAALVIGTLATVYQASAQGLPGLAGAWSAGVGHDDGSPMRPIDAKRDRHGQP